MSTRGFVGFVVDGVEKITYNHSDSYPDWLGVKTLKWLRSTTGADMLAGARSLRVVSSDSEATDEDVARLGRFANQNVSTRDAHEWYVLLRETQGDLSAMLDAGVIIDGSDFPGDSLYAEWGYIVNLDAGAFEVYVGFQHEPHSKGRFAGRDVKHLSVGDYYPCALFTSWPLDTLPSDEEFLKALSDGDGE